jgi:hypothetical protein
MIQSEKKLQFQGILRLSVTVDRKPDLDAIATELDVTVSCLRQWAHETAEMDQSEAILQLLELDMDILDDVTSHESEKAVTDDTEPRVELIDGVITVTDPKAKMVSKAKKDKIAAFKEGVTGLQLLNTELQGTAGTIVGKIADLVEDTDLTARDLQSLTTALTSIQQAFFNKPTTNIQVNAVGSEGVSLLKKFQDRLSS